MTSKLWTELKESLVKIGLTFFLAHFLEMNVYFKCKMIWLETLMCDEIYLLHIRKYILKENMQKLPINFNNHNCFVFFILAQ